MKKHIKIEFDADVPLGELEGHSNEDLAKSLAEDFGSDHPKEITNLAVTVTEVIQ